MDTKEVTRLLMLQNGATLFGATYVDGVQTGKVYHFMDSLGLGLEEGDLVVVETRDTKCLVKVTQTNVRASKMEFGVGTIKLAVAKVDLSAYEAAKEREAQAEERLAMAEVFERLEKYEKQLGAGRMGEVAALLGGTASVVEDEHEAFTGRADGKYYVNGREVNVGDYDAHLFNERNK